MGDWIFQATEMEMLMQHGANEAGADIDLHDLLKQRVDAGEPIYINGQSTPAVDANGKHDGD